MYQHVSAVVWGLILSLFMIVATAIVAVIDPFNNGVPWANWLTMSVIAVIAVITSTSVAVHADTEENFWGLLGAILLGWLIFGSMLVGLFFTSAATGGLRPEYHSLAWSGFAIPFLVLPVSALVQYLVGARNSRLSDSRVRRIA